MKILIKGAGDLATGIASRLYGAGHQILMTEIAQPLTVRRTVALSRAVYDRRAIVEEMEAVSAKTQEDAEAIMEEGKIPVIVDPKADCRKWYKPDVIVDAIIAKKNTGTKITDAPFVIGIGPGFTAGKDCHCVIETKRGHTLGSVIWEGSAIADTGVPGNIGGYTTERLIRASEDGIIEPKVRIGDIVEKRADCCSNRRKTGFRPNGRDRERNAAAGGVCEEESENRRYRCPRGAFPLRDDFGQGKSNRRRSA